VSSSSSNVSETLSFVFETNFRFLPLQTAAIFYLWLVVSKSVTSNSIQSNTLPRIRVVHGPHTLRVQCVTIDIHPSRLECGGVHIGIWESMRRRRLPFPRWSVTVSIFRIVQEELNSHGFNVFNYMILITDYLHSISKQTKKYNKKFTLPCCHYNRHHHPFLVGLLVFLLITLLAMFSFLPQSFIFQTS